MHLTWHIACKDLRHFWPWFALIATTILARYAIVWNLEHSLSIDRPFFDQTARIESTLLVIQLALCGLFVVAVLHDDSPLDPHSFRVTRPISGLRFLAAKLITIVIGSICLPLIGTLLWWWLHDFRSCEITASFPTFLLRYSTVAAAFFALALFNRTWPGFIVSAVVSVIAASLFFTWLEKKNSGFSSPFSSPHFIPAFFCATAVIVACACFIFQRGRPAIARSIFVAAATLFLLIAAIGPWEAHARYYLLGDPLPGISPPSAPKTSPSDVQVRRAVPVASVNATPADSDHTGPYHLRILKPSPPHRSFQNWDETRSITCLLVHPAQLTSPDSDISEYCGAPDDTDEYGRYAKERSTISATLHDRAIGLARNYSLTFAVDGVFFVRRSLSLNLSPADVASVKLHYVVYPAVGAFEPPPSSHATDAL